MNFRYSRIPPFRGLSIALVDFFSAGCLKVGFAQEKKYVRTTARSKANLAKGMAVRKSLGGAAPAMKGQDQIASGTAKVPTSVPPD
jgi:hypothetical protein